MNTDFRVPTPEVLNQGVCGGVGEPKFLTDELTAAAAAGSRSENHWPRAEDRRLCNGISMPICNLTQPLSSCPQGQVT